MLKLAPLCEDGSPFPKNLSPCKLREYYVRSIYDAVDSCTLFPEIEEFLEGRLDNIAKTIFKYIGYFENLGECWERRMKRDVPPEIVEELRKISYIEYRWTGNCQIDDFRDECERVIGKQECQRHFREFRKWLKEWRENHK